VRTYGEQLKALRKALDLPQETVAERMGYKRQGNLSLYENDKKRPSVKTVLRHARAYGKTPSEFLTGVIVTEYDRIRAGEYDVDIVLHDKSKGTVTLIEAKPTRKAREVKSRHRRGGVG
jgi:transcriptional regulator with XRE-family HTH domain